MKRLFITVHLEVKADPDDDDAIKEAVYDKLTEDLEAEEVDWELVETEEEDDEEEY